MDNIALLEKEDRDLIKHLSAYLTRKYRLPRPLLIELFADEKKFVLSIPLSLFSKKLGVLETLVKYLRENMNLKFVEIAQLLDRSTSTVLTTYRKALKKFPSHFIITNLDNMIPLSIFRNRKYSNLELIVSYLKEELEMSNQHIAEKLERDNRTIWTVYSRYKKKKNEKE
ncbi:hypothetical protein JW930_01805 [Candidatus Woesearchaeota archaeon]|nr:hypothetical protein [Candidatus Woesearchaeota archaeon]